jgi:hypothetical protein
LHLANNTYTIATGSSQNAKGATSTQTNRGGPHQWLSRAPLPIQLIQGNVELEQIQVEDWEDEAFEDEVADEEKLARV